MKKLLALITFILLVANQSAAITIDKFDAGSYDPMSAGSPCRVKADPLTPVNSTAVVLPTVAGGVRELTLTSEVFTVSSFLCIDLATYSQGAGNKGLARFVWDGDSASGVTSVDKLGPLNLTEDGATEFLFNILHDGDAERLPFPVTVTVYDATDSTLGKWSRSTVMVGGTTHPAGGVFFDLPFPFSGFNNSGPNGHADFKKIGAIEILIDGRGTPSLDLQIRSIATNGNCQEVPTNGTVLDECGVCAGPGPGVCGCGIPDTDSDMDGVPNCNDECELDPLKTSPGVCGCGVLDADLDKDGTADCLDACPNDPDKMAPGVCGCGVADEDFDQDGTLNCLDQCPLNPNKTKPGKCGCDAADSDGDGVEDCEDLCPLDPDKTAPGTCGCGESDIDTDRDGVVNCLDLCPNDGTKTEPGICGCGVSDNDSDGDGVPSCQDGCPQDPAKTSPGVCGCGVSEGDTDGDGQIECIDSCPNDPLKDSPGVCGCGVADTDSDNDGTPDCTDSCPSDSTKTVPGLCGCGSPESDSDSDGILDCLDGCPLTGTMTEPGACGCSTQTQDNCGVCGGDGLSCCESTNQQPSQFEIDANLAEQERRVALLSKRLKRLATTKADKRFARKTLAAANELNTQGWQLIWVSIPGDVLSCPTQENSCVFVSYEEEAKELQSVIDSFYTLTRQTTRRIRKLRDGKLKRKERKLLQAAKSFQAENTALVSGLAVTETVCP